MTDEPRPWDRREDKTARAYAAFTVYRDLGSGRPTGATPLYFRKHF